MWQLREWNGLRQNHVSARCDCRAKCERGRPYDLVTFALWFRRKSYELDFQSYILIFFWYDRLQDSHISKAIEQSKRNICLSALTTTGDGLGWVTKSRIWIWVSKSLPPQTSKDTPVASWQHGPEMFSLRWTRFCACWWIGRSSVAACHGNYVRLNKKVWSSTKYIIIKHRVWFQINLK